MSAEETKYQIVSRIIKGMSNTEIALDLEIPTTKVMRIKREYNDAVASNAVDAYINMDTVLAEQLLATVVDGVPAELKGQATEAAATIKATKSLLEGLSDDMVLTAKRVTDRIKTELNSIEHVSELESLTDSLCKLQNAFFNQNKTQVNVQNNYGQEPGEGSGSASYGAFLNDKPANH